MDKPQEEEVERAAVTLGIDGFRRCLIKHDVRQMITACQSGATVGCHQLYQDYILVLGRDGRGIHSADITTGSSRRTVGTNQEGGEAYMYTRSP